MQSQWLAAVWYTEEMKKPADYWVKEGTQRNKKNVTKQPSGQQHWEWNFFFLF